MFVTTDDGVRLRAIGEQGPAPLVFSNSLGTDVGLFDSQAKVFEGERAVWRYDTRGHGRSDVPSGDYTVERLGTDLLSVIDATSAPQVDLCGVSIGGLTALWVAVRAPNRVRRLILANTAARIGNHALWNERIRLVRAEGMRSLAEATMTRWFTEEFRAQQPDVVQKFRSTIERTSVDGYAGCCAALRDADLRSLAATVTCPTLVVTGRHDPATPAADGQWLASQIHGARIVEFDSAHLSNVECATEFNAAAQDFFNEDDRGLRHG
jgi:3-oxoadipate enol-lactonase